MHRKYRFLNAYNVYIFYLKHIFGNCIKYYIRKLNFGFISLFALKPKITVIFAKKKT